MRLDSFENDYIRKNECGSNHRQILKSVEGFNQNKEKEPGRKADIRQLESWSINLADYDSQGDICANRNQIIACKIVGTSRFLPSTNNSLPSFMFGIERDSGFSRYSRKLTNGNFPFLISEAAR